jgi:hypothetical protein
VLSPATSIATVGVIVTRLAYTQELDERNLRQRPVFVNKPSYSSVLDIFSAKICRSDFAPGSFRSG